MSQKTYCAIIGDINRSRSLENRAKVQRRFASAIDTINKEFKTSVASKFLITLGDEFQGLLVSAEQSYDLVRRFQDLMEPVPFAFGIGIGTLSTLLRKDKTLGMDGEAFHRARQALDESKHKKRTVNYSFNSGSEDIINALIGLMDKQWLRLTARQRRVVRLLKEQSAKEVSRRLRITTQAISKAKRSAGMVELEEAAEVLRKFMKNLKQP